MKLCEWCEAVVDDESQELCHKCFDAQRRVAAGNLIPATPEKKSTQLPQTIGRHALNVLIAIGRSILFLVLGWLMLVIGLLGTCLTLGALSSAVVAPLTALGLLFAAVLAFAAVYGVYKLTNLMLRSPPKAIDRKHKPPRQIGRND